MSSGEWRSHYDGHYANDAASPEKRLWMAVIEKAVWDFRLRLKHARRDLMRSGQINSFIIWDLKTLRYEISSDWFWEMASYAGMDAGRIVKFLDKEALAAGVDLSKPALNPSAHYLRMKDRII